MRTRAGLPLFAGLLQRPPNALAGRMRLAERLSLRPLASRQTHRAPLQRFRVARPAGARAGTAATTYDYDAPWDIVFLPIDALCCGECFRRDQVGGIAVCADCIFVWIQGFSPALAGVAPGLNRRCCGSANRRSDSMRCLRSRGRRWYRLPVAARAAPRPMSMPRTTTYCRGVARCTDLRRTCIVRMMGTHTRAVRRPAPVPDLLRFCISRIVSSFSFSPLPSRAVVASTVL